MRAKRGRSVGHDDCAKERTNLKKVKVDRGEYDQCLLKSKGYA